MFFRAFRVFRGFTFLFTLFLLIHPVLWLTDLLTTGQDEPKPKHTEKKEEKTRNQWNARKYTEKASVEFSDLTIAESRNRTWEPPECNLLPRCKLCISVRSRFEEQFMARKFLPCFLIVLTVCSVAMAQDAKPDPEAEKAKAERRAKLLAAIEEDAKQLRLPRRSPRRRGRPTKNRLGSFSNRRSTS